MNIGLLGLGSLLTPQIKRSVFVSYHHGGDQHYYQAFSSVFSETCGIFRDRSLVRAYNSDDTDYVRWQIRQNDITGTSCTIVLCGAGTPTRKYVDWEIKATLDKSHGLIGIWLPTLPLGQNGGTDKPARLQDNLDSGYAKWIRWDQLSAESLRMTIESSVVAPRSLIQNWRPLRQRNG